MPDLASRKLASTSWVLLPMDETMPIPVTTTRLIIFLVHFGFDVTDSKSMTLRKPEEFFKGLAMGKRALTAAFKTLKTKPATPNGRINEECIILGAF